MEHGVPAARGPTRRRSRRMTSSGSEGRPKVPPEEALAEVGREAPPDADDVPGEVADGQPE
eukprot:11726487-Alexandrium_andersonii.AAC.1